jgi:hypothetical protein
MIVQRQALLLQGVFSVPRLHARRRSKPGPHSRRAARQPAPRTTDLLNLLFWQQLFWIRQFLKGLLYPAEA